VLWLQRRLMFFPEVLGDDAELSFSVPHEERWFASPTGNRLHAVTVRSRAPRVGTIVYWHGNAGSLRSWGEIGAELASFGYDVVVPDYAGFGKSRGTLSEPAILADAQHVYDVVKGETDERELVVFGRSLGSGPATYLAAKNAPRALLLETPYASIVDVAQRLLRVPAFLLSIRFRSDLWMREVRCPVHVFHGTADRVIPFASAEVLRPLLPPSSTFTVIPGGGHSDLAAFALYRGALGRALAGSP
jgi:pimeloyl-ACP methyl ester carboxylesterase